MRERFLPIERMDEELSAFGQYQMHTGRSEGPVASVPLYTNE